MIKNLVSLEWYFSLFVSNSQRHQARRVESPRSPNRGPIIFSVFSTATRQRETNPLASVFPATHLPTRTTRYQWLRTTTHRARHQLTNDAECATHSHRATARPTRQDEGPIAATAATTTPRRAIRRARPRDDDGARCLPLARALARGPSRRPLAVQRGGAPHRGRGRAHRPPRRRTARGQSPFRPSPHRRQQSRPRRRRRHKHR